MEIPRNVTRTASLCTGSGALDMAVSAVFGGEVAWHAEIDRDTSQLLALHYPHVPNLGDFTRPGFWTGVERCDIHTGGIPCQPFSAAGRQQGADDPRHLWPYWKIGIAIQRPSIVAFENVANLTRGKMRPVFDLIIQDLVDLGYNVRWCLLGACAVGAAHHRHRVFLLAVLDSVPGVREVQVQTCGQSEAAYLPTPSSVSYGSNQGGAAGRTGPVRHSLDSMARLELLPTTKARDWKGGGHDSAADKLLRGRHDLDDLVALNLLPTPAARDGGGRGTGGNAQRRLEMGRAGDTRVHKQMDLPTTLQLLPTPRHSDAKNGGPNQGIASGDIALSSAVQPERWGVYADAIARHEAVLGRPVPNPTEVGPKGGVRLAAAFSEWLMMLPEGHLTGVEYVPAKPTRAPESYRRNAALKRAGNGVVPLQAETAFRLLAAAE